MSVVEPQPAAPKATLRWYWPAPGRFLVLLVAVEGLFLLSAWRQWVDPIDIRGCEIILTIVFLGASFAIMLLWFVLALIFRWRFQFSVRSLLVMVLVVAIPCAWLRAAQDRERKEILVEKEALAHIQAAGGKWASGSEPLGGPCWITGITFFGSNLSDAGLVDVLPYLRRLRGLDYLNLGKTAITDRSVENLCAEIRSPDGLPRLGGLELGHTRITDAGLKRVNGLSQLQWLDVEGTGITDAGLECLDKLNQLTSLNLDDTQVTDAGLVHVGDRATLNYLELSGTRITDAGLQYLKGLTRLRRLECKNTKVTSQGLQDLRRAIPQCEIWSS